MSPPIVTVTVNPCVDKNTRIDRVVTERKLRCEAPRFEAGGGGLNVSRALLELGEPSQAFWFCGGHSGALLAELLTGQGVQHHPLAIENSLRQNLIVYERDTQQQYRFGMPGPVIAPAERERLVRALADLSPQPEYLVLSGSLPKGIDTDFYRVLAEAAADTTRVVLDASGEALTRGLEAGVFLVKPNLRELGLLVGRELQSDQEIEDAAQTLITRKHAQVVIVSLGAGGAMLVSEEGTSLVRSPTVPIRSKVGAGDCTLAGAVLGFRRFGGNHDAARLGVAAGAAAVMTDGTELCKREDVERLFDALRTTHPSVPPGAP